MPLLTKCSAFKDVITRLALLLEQGRVRVVVSSRGSYQSLALRSGSTGFSATDEQIDLAHQRIVGLLLRCEDSLKTLESPMHQSRSAGVVKDMLKKGHANPTH